MLAWLIQTDEQASARSRSGERRSCFALLGSAEEGLVGSCATCLQGLLSIVSHQSFFPRSECVVEIEIVFWSTFSFGNQFLNVWESSEIHCNSVSLPPGSLWMFVEFRSRRCSPLSPVGFQQGSG